MADKTFGALLAISLLALGLMGKQEAEIALEQYNAVSVLLALSWLGSRTVWGTFEPIYCWHPGLLLGNQEPVDISPATFVTEAELYDLAILICRSA